MQENPSSAAPLPGSENDVDNLVAKVDLLKHQVDGVQAALARRSKPWYGQSALLIAMLALVVLTCAVVASYRVTQAQDSQAVRGKLQELAQRVGALQQESRSPQGQTLNAEPQPAQASMASTVDLMKNQIDGLRIALINTQAKPWYRDPSTLISMMALLFSFGTTFVSYHRTEVQDIQSSRQELRGILQRISAIPREEIAARKYYAGDANTIQSISQLNNQENTILVRQASEIARKLPPNMVSATEYYAIAVAQQNAYDLRGAKEFIRLAAANATSFNDEIAAVRSEAFLDFLTGEHQAGRAKYEQALNIFTKYPDYDQYTKINACVQTELAWGSSEAGIGQFSLALDHVNKAREQVNTLPNSPGAESLKQQIASLAQVIDMANSSEGKTMPLSVSTTLPH